MASESELCVDELLLRNRKAEELHRKFGSEPTPGHIEEARTLVRDTQLIIDNNKSVIPSFILKKVSDALRKLESLIDSSNKSKLTFKFKAKSTDVHSPKSTRSQSESKPSELVSEEIVSRNFLGFQDKKDERLTLGPDEVDSKDISLVDLNGCTVSISGLANTVYIRNLNNTTVTICLACRAITVRNCTGCRLNLICQQLRIDSTIDCELNIFTSARSMLEASKGLTFKELKLNDTRLTEFGFPLERVQQFLTQVGFDVTQNNWRCIDDFDWLSPDVPSKNYMLQ